MEGYPKLALNILGEWIEVITLARYIMDVSNFGPR